MVVQLKADIGKEESFRQMARTLPFFKTDRWPRGRWGHSECTTGDKKAKLKRGESMGTCYFFRHNPGSIVHECFIAKDAEQFAVRVRLSSLTCMGVFPGGRSITLIASQLAANYSGHLGNDVAAP